MPNERLITEIETLLSELIDLGGKKEKTSIIPNMLVRNASPSGLTDYVIIADNRDNDNILALKVPGVVYNNNDLVNVIFVEGGEAIAFQQGSGSSSSGLWAIVPATTDIYYNQGDVGIGKAVAPDAALEVLSTSQAQLRLTHTEDTKFVTFTLDTNHDLTIKPSSTGQIKLQPTTDSTDFFQVLDADGGTPILNVDSTNERVGVGLSAPGGKVEINAATASEDALILQSTDDSNTNEILSVQVSGGTEVMRASVPVAGTLYRTLTVDTSGIATGARSLPVAIIYDDDATSLVASISSAAFFKNANTTNNNYVSLMFVGQTVSPSSELTMGHIACVITDHTLATLATDIAFINRSGGSLVEQLRLRSDGDLLLGVPTAAGSGRIHGYDSISGFKHWEYDGLDGTSRTIIPNNVGDVLYNLTGRYNLRDSSGNVVDGAVSVANGGSQAIAVGGNTVTIAVAATGATTISRTAGADTIKVGLWLLWL